MVPLPVAGEAPPMKQAAMASPSKPFPIMVEQEFILAVNTIPAIAARTDMFRYTIKSTRSSLMPDSLAALRFPHTAYRFLPATVFSRIKL